MHFESIFLGVYSESSDLQDKLLTLHINFSGESQCNSYYMHGALDNALQKHI